MKTFIHAPAQAQPTRLRQLARQLAGSVLTPAYWLLAHRFHTPGLRFHWLCAQFGLGLLFNRQAPISPGWAYQFTFAPMDSTRYFEFDFAWRALAETPMERYLDVSSPRLFSLVLLSHQSGTTADLINPDNNDLNTTIQLLHASGLAARCQWHNCLIESAPCAPASFDAITCLSVVEHIPRDAEAIEKMWEWLKPGGRLLLTVPCAATPSEQYIDHNEFGVLLPDERGYVFWQRYYDEARLQEKVFSLIGLPSRHAIYGEKIAGAFQRNAARKRAEYFTRYPFWREPYMMGQEYAYFDAIADLPGEGVIAMEFIKP